MTRAFAVDDGDDVGVWIGSALGGLAFAESQHDAFREHGTKAVRPLLAISVFGGAATTQRRARVRHPRSERGQR